MKKTLVFMMVIVFVASAFSLGFTDVGEDHWAYDYVMKLVEKGVIPVDEPTFRGYEPLTRSDAAVWMTRLVTYLENSPEIAKTKDLEYLEAKVKDLSKKVDSASNEVKSLSDSLNQGDLLADLQASYSDVKKTAYRAKNIGDSLTEDLLMVTADVDQLKANYEVLSKTVDETKTLAEQNSMFVKALPNISRKVADNESKINALDQRVSSLESFQQTMIRNHLNLKYDTYDKIDNLSNTVAANEEEILALSKDVQSLSQQVSDVKSLAETNKIFSDSLKVILPNLNQRITANETKVKELSQQVDLNTQELEKGKDEKLLLWITAGLGVFLGSLGIYFAQQ